MEELFTQENKIIFTIAASVVVFAYFKYRKKSVLESKYAFSIGLIALAIGCFFTGFKYPISTLIEILFMNENVPVMLEKLFMLGYMFVLLGAMAFIDELLNKGKKA